MFFHRRERLNKKIVHSQNLATGAGAAGVSLGIGANLQKSLPLSLGAAGASAIALTANHHANLLARKEGFRKPVIKRRTSIG